MSLRPASRNPVPRTLYPVFVATLLNPPTTSQPVRGISAPLQRWHLASLDAPTVAVVWAWAFTWAAHVRLPLWAGAALALIVWSIYIADRLLDAHAGLRTPPAHCLRERHSFHWRNRRVLLPLAVLSAAVAMVLIFLQLPARSFRPDSLVAAATLLWLTSVHAGRKPQAPYDFSRIRETRIREMGSEIIVGTLFTLGCALPVSSQLGAAHSLTQFLRLPLAPLLVYAALAWLNLHAIAVWESHPATAGLCRVQIPSAGIAFAALLLAFFSIPRSAALLSVAACSSLLFLFLDRNRKNLSPLTLRAVADLVLLTPLLLAPVAILFP